MSDYRTSLLVNRQVPEFVRDDHPLFVAFLEAYYEFLENKQGSENNDLTNRAKQLRDLSDVDLSIDNFEEAFFNMYASLVPRDTLVDKTTLLKNVLPLYLSKGSEKSFKLLFRMLFGSELTVSYPKSEVLRASDGKWLVEKYLKVNDVAYAQYTGDGSTKEYDLPPVMNSNVRVVVNGVSFTDFFVRKEIQKLYFNTAPASGVDIKIYFDNFDFTVVKTRKAVGTISGAYALIERVGSQILQNELVHEFYVDEKSKVGEFNIGEVVRVDVFNYTNDGLVSLYFRGLSSVVNINVIEGGSNYRVGDDVILNTPAADIKPTAYVSKVFSGTINKTTIHNGGAGFTFPNYVDADGFSSSDLLLAINDVDAEVANSVATSYQIFQNLIGDVDPANTKLDVADWHFTGNTNNNGVSNANSVIATTLTSTQFTNIGAISNVSVFRANTIVYTPPKFHARPAVISLASLTGNTTSSNASITTYGSIGKLIISNAGTGYRAGDEIIFTNPRGSMSLGIGAQAEISNVSSTGVILEVKLLPPKITGTANVWSLSNTRVQGHNTQFFTDLKVGDLIVINSSNTRTAKYETKQVVSIDSDTSLNVNTAFTSSFVTDHSIRKIGTYPVGGQNYVENNLPTVTISSATGTDGVITIGALLGMGDDIEGRGTKRPGEIEEIAIQTPGYGITIIPQVDLTQSGDGLATAEVQLSPTYDSLPGRWTSSDGIISSDRKIQGRGFYGDYAYVTKSQVEFSKYKKIFKDLLHPAGFKEYAEWEKDTVLDATPVTLNIVTAPKNIKSLSGLVNIAESSITVTGLGTKFNVANTNGIITVGSYIAINSDIRMVNAIISNTVLTVSSPFTITANLEEVVVINTAYDAIATEVTLEEITTETEISLTVE